MTGKGGEPPGEAGRAAELRVDHVTVAGSRLGPLREAFAVLGLEAEYGGVHSSGATHMAVLGFDDGSYVELLSTLEPGAAAPVWDRFIREDAGPAAWAVRTDDIGKDVGRLRAAGVPVEGPARWHRDRPDGTRAEWELAFPREPHAGPALPFLIQDRTPRERRVRPSAAVAGSELAGVAAAVVGFPSLEEGVGLFRRVYGWGPPREGRSEGLEAALAAFPGRPVVLAEPLAPGGWLAGRLARFGPCPCAFLLLTRDPDRSARRAEGALSTRETWPLGAVRWFDPDILPGGRLGLLSARSGRDVPQPSASSHISSNST